MTAVADAPYFSANTAPTINEHGAPTVASLPVRSIVASPRNPRRHFDDAALQELADSIREHGIIEPLIVQRPVAASGGGFTYVLIAGERRLRAAQLAGLTHVPARIIDVDERAAMRLRLIENLQRVDLDAIDEALGYRALHDELGMTQAEIAKAVNRSQPSIANAMRVLDLPADVVERIRTGELTRGHGVALAKYKLAPALQSRLARYAVEHQQTVKQVESPRYLYSQQYVEEGLLRFVNPWQTGFETAICNTCPFGAYIPGTDTGDYNNYCQPVCLKPEHFDQLQKEAEKRRNAETQRAVAATKAGGTGVLRLDRLQPGDYVRLANEGWEKPLPSGCSESCPCYAKALRGEGHGEDRLVPVCTDPKRHAALEAADAKLLKAKRREEYRRRREQLEQQVDELRGFLVRAEEGLLGLDRPLAVIASAALNEVLNADIRKAILARHGVALPNDLGNYQIGPEQLDSLRKLTAGPLLTITLEAVLRGDLAARYEIDRAENGKRADWYLGKLTETSLPAAGAER